MNIFLITLEKKKQIETETYWKNVVQNKKIKNKKNALKYSSIKDSG